MLHDYQGCDFIIFIDPFLRPCLCSGSDKLRRTQKFADL